jgi:hypothetical protein
VTTRGLAERMEARDEVRVLCPVTDAVLKVERGLRDSKTAILSRAL